MLIYDFGVHSLFDAAEVSSLILASVELLQYDHRTFSLAVGMFLLVLSLSSWDELAIVLTNFSLPLSGEKLALDQAPAALVGAGKIDAVLTGAIAYYTV